ncbi:MAG: HAD family phosphatase [Lachnospiraceae bacterium]|nr:HAD family phosphatase [Lachnospiraceae bacterium]
MEKKLLFVDLDGTLLNDNKEITPENRAAMEQAIQLGHAIVVTTGRAMVSAQKQVERLGLTGPGCYAITSNGALIFDTHSGEIVFKTGVPREVIRPIFDEAYAFGLHAQTYTADHAVCERAGREMEYYSRTTLLPYLLVDDAAAALSEDPVKLLFIDLYNKQNLENFRAHMEPYAREHGLDMFFSSELYLEFLPHGINKGSGVRFLSQLLHVPLSQTIAAGDAENDITMLQAAGTACVMANASSDMKRYGDYVTQRDNNHSGIAEIIERFLLCNHP